MKTTCKCITGGQTGKIGKYKGSQEGRSRFQGKRPRQNGAKKARAHETLALAARLPVGFGRRVGPFCSDRWMQDLGGEGHDRHGHAQLLTIEQ